MSAFYACPLNMTSKLPEFTFKLLQFFKALVSVRVFKMYYPSMSK